MTSNTAKKKTTQENLGVEQKIYDSRFEDSEEQTRLITWQVLCDQFFSKYVKPDDVVLDIGAGDGHFLKKINAKTKIAVDLGDHVKRLEKEGIEVIQVPATEINQHLKEKVDVVMMSNFLEHLPTKAVLLEVLKEVKQVIKPGGSLLILQPNIRYAKAAYWDYVDHHIALTERSLEEALDITGYEIAELVPQFLPYTVKSKAGKFAEFIDTKTLIETYLKFPFLWKIFGAQTFVHAKVGENK